MSGEPECLICSRPEHEHRDSNGHGFVPAPTPVPSGVAETTAGEREDFCGCDGIVCCSRCRLVNPTPAEPGGITTAEVRDLLDEHGASPWPEGCALCGYTGDDETGWTITATGPTVAPVCPTCAGPYVSLIAYLRHSMPSGQAISDLHTLLDRVRREEGAKVLREAAEATEGECWCQVDLNPGSSESCEAITDEAAEWLRSRAASVGRGEGG